jgi:hypothetical protein
MKESSYFTYIYSSIQTFFSSYNLAKYWILFSKYGDFEKKKFPIIWGLEPIFFPLKKKNKNPFFPCFNLFFHHIKSAEGVIGASSGET